MNAGGVLERDHTVPAPAESLGDGVPTFFVADTTALSVVGLQAHGEGSGWL